MSLPLKIGVRRRIVQRLNNLFKASARSAGRKLRMCVRIVQTQMQSKIKCGFTTLRQDVPILHRIFIAHMTFSDKNIIIKPYFLYFLCHQCSTIVDTSLMLFLCSLKYVFYVKNSKKTHLS